MSLQTKKNLKPAKNALSIEAMIKEDHKKVKKLFMEFEDAESEAEKEEIAEEAITEIKIHATLEEEILYPALRMIMEEDKIDEAEEEHLVVRNLIEEIEDFSNEKWCAKFYVLSEMVKHHIKEEELDMLPHTSKLGDEIKSELIERKEELKNEIG